MRTTAAVLLGLVLVACSSATPVAINAGDLCFHCQKPITQVKVAAEAVTAAGVPLKFRCPECMARHLTRSADRMTAMFVTDYPSGRFIRAENATFVKAPIEEGATDSAHFAFADVRAAIEFGKANSSNPIDWLSIVKQVRAAPAD